jgi:phosphoribosylglycinamide formyltransferase-1
MARKTLAVLISGRGTNLQSLIDACRDDDFPARIGVVVSDVPGIMGLDRAELDDIPTAVVEPGDHDDVAAFENAIHKALTKAKTDLVCLAGFMRLLSPGFVERWHDRLINVHPSLLPAFKGLRVHERVLESGVRFSGCTVHFVRPEMDAGPIIVQSVVPVRPDDDLDSLAARILRQEHRIYPMAVRLLAEGRVAVRDGRAEIDGLVTPGGAMINPLEAEETG